jgi:hypothetical protein
VSLLPTDFDVTLSLADVLRGAGLPYATGCVDVSAIPDVPRRGYRIIGCIRVRAPLSELLSGLLQRPFLDQEQGWVINAREARMLVKLFNR